MKNRTRLFIFFLIFLLFTPSVHARKGDYSFLDIQVAVVDTQGMVEGFDQSYLIEDTGFILVNNLRVIRVLYTSGNVTIMDDKTLSRMTFMDLVDGARLRVYDVNNNDTLVFDGWTYEKTLSNFFNYGSGKYFNNAIILAPITLGFSLLITYSLLTLYKRRVI